MLCKEFELLTAPAENQRIAALQPNNRLDLVQVVKNVRIDLGLDLFLLPMPLSCVNEDGVRSRQGQNFSAYQPVVNHDIGLLEDADRLARQQIGIARTSTHQVDFCRTAQRASS